MYTQRSWAGKALGELKELKTAGALYVREEGWEIRLEEWQEPLSVGSYFAAALSVFPIPPNPMRYQYCEHRKHIYHHPS